MKSIVTSILLCITLAIVGQNQSDLDNAVRAFVEIENNCLRLKWLPDADVTGYQIQRKDNVSLTWGGTYVAELGAMDTTYLDCDVEVGHLYEYRIIKTHTEGVGYSYLYSGIELQPVHDRGTLLVLIDEPSYSELDIEIENYLRVIRSEGWKVDTMIINRNTSVVDIRSQIIKYNEATPLTSILILGHVPVPQSGNIAPDGHNNHYGAWSADLYYGELDGNWTDSSIDVTTSGNSNNHNVPGDNRLDQSFIPSDIDVAVGRVDFYDLPVFDEDEFELLKKYLDKSIAFRTKQFTPRRRATMRENFNRAEAFGQGAVRNFSAFVSPDSVTYKEFNNAFEESYLWLYGAGGGSYTGASGICNSAKFASDSLQAVFTMLFGSYFGDYNSKNNFMRSALASGTTLSCSWSGRPHWVYHPMGMGFDLGYATRLTQNNSGKYTTGYGGRFVHVNLLGDPTLNSFAVGPPSNLVATEEAGNILLEWTQSDDDVMGYYLYRREVGDDQFILVSNEIITSNFYRDSCQSPFIPIEYRIRAVKLEKTASGSYYNLSGGPSYVITPTIDLSVDAIFDFTLNGQIVNLVNLSNGHSGITWFLPDGTTSTEDELDFTLLNNEENEITLVAFNACFSDTLTQAIFYSNVEETSISNVSIYPNPNAGNFYVKNVNQPFKIELYNNEGKRVFYKNAVPGEAIQVETLPVGLYYYQILLPHSTAQGRVSIH